MENNNVPQTGELRNLLCIYQQDLDDFIQWVKTATPAERMAIKTIMMLMISRYNKQLNSLNRN